MYVATDETSQSWILISASISGDPTGNWCNWAIQGDTNGDTPAGNWSDFPQLGFDNSAVYLGLNQFTFAEDPQFVYAKVRILPKGPLYACSQLSWYDFWDLREPDSPQRARSVRPAVGLAPSGTAQLASVTGFSTVDRLHLWTLTNPATQSPALSAVSIPIAAALRPPDADQLGGSPGRPNCPAPCRLDTGDGRLLSVVSRGGSLWAAHTVAGGSGNSFSRVRYVRIDLASRALLQDQSLGVDGCWYFYPSLSVDAGGSFAMVFGRSCSDEYAGIRFSGRSAGDSSIQASTLLKGGEANYVNSGTLPEGRNRWGDYFGAAADPADSTKLWLFGQYAAAANTWGTYIAQAAVTCTAPAIPVAGSNSPITAGQTLQLTAVSSPGATYSWFGPNGFRSTLQNPSIPNASVSAAGTYSVSASFGGCTSLSRTTAVTVLPPAGACVPSGTSLCLNGSRFRVTARWQSATGSGDGQAVRLTADTGYIWFFDSANVEAVVKVLNACPLNNRYWVFAGGLTNVNVVLTISDTQTGATRIYTNPQGAAFQPIQDTSAFATCP